MVAKPPARPIDWAIIYKPVADEEMIVSPTSDTEDTKWEVDAGNQSFQRIGQVLGKIERFIENAPMPLKPRELAKLSEQGRLDHIHRCNLLTEAYSKFGHIQPILRARKERARLNWRELAARATLKWILRRRALLKAQKGKSSLTSPTLPLITPDDIHITPSSWHRATISAPASPRDLKRQLQKIEAKLPPVDQMIREEVTRTLTGLKDQVSELEKRLTLGEQSQENTETYLRDSMQKLITSLDGMEGMLNVHAMDAKKAEERIEAVWEKKLLVAKAEWTQKTKEMEAKHKAELSEIKQEMMRMHLDHVELKTKIDRILFGLKAATTSPTPGSLP